MKHNIPLIKRNNFYLDDSFVTEYFKSRVSDAHKNIYEPFLVKIGESSARCIDEAFIADQNPPKLNKFTVLGEIQNKIEYHESYKKLKEASYGQGLLEFKYDSNGLNGPHKEQRHFIGFMAGFLFSQVDTGLFCPICMTDSLAWVLENHLKSEPGNTNIEEALKGLTTSDLENLFEGAMFLTERQGGSDVGANTVEAYQENGVWKIKGHKWFCSNADAEVALVLARMPSGLEGTKGLGLFLFRRSQAENYEIVRLKDKLGVRSMASGEIDFKGTKVELLAGEKQGFKKMAEMVNMSRIYNSIASLGVARRAIEETKLWGEKRKGFGKTLNEHSLWQRQVSDLDGDFRSLFDLTFTTIKYLDAYENGDEEAQLFFRHLTPIVKAVCGKFGVFAASECMELIGGNAYIEDFKFAKLYRDVQVLPIWEGTTNIQALDLLRVFLKEPKVMELLEKEFFEDSLVNWHKFKEKFTMLQKSSQLEEQADKLLYELCNIWLVHLGHRPLRTSQMIY
jgi:alkylation response protein AidB-like acyl-CoA dehydrogenase